jgi:hypothetical protein
MNGTPDMITAGLKMAASLGVVLAMMFLLLYGIRKLTGQRMGTTGGKRIQVLESHYMGVKKTLSLVGYRERFWCWAFPVIASICWIRWMTTLSSRRCRRLHRHHSGRFYPID